MKSRAMTILLKLSADDLAQGISLKGMDSLRFIIVDDACHMPDMDGPALVRTLREKKLALPIIMVSGSTRNRRAIGGRLMFR